MNRLLYILLISAITIVGFTMFQQKDLGQISIGFAGYSFDTNLVVFGAAILSALFVVLVLIKSWHLIKNTFIYLGGRRKKRLVEKARLSLSQGLIEYAEGRFEQAEKILLQQIKYSDNRLLAYLSAARAAQQLGAHERRDEYLRKAHLEAPKADVAIGLTKAELQLAHDQNEQALATLTQLNKLSENHTYVLTLLANTYKHLQDWDNLKKILPAFKKHGNLSEESFLSFEIIVCNGQLNKLAKSKDGQLLINFWKDTPHHLKTLPGVIEHYAKQLVAAGAAGEAEKTLRLYLNKSWEESSIILYSELDVMADNKQLEMVESWLKDHQHNAWLLLALGKICISRSLWGKAKNYLEASISISPMPENYLKLARLLEEHMEEPTAAQEYYRQGLHLLAGDYGEEILKTNADDFEHETPQLKIVKT
ncbi:MAG: heme biosynthesis HemY N-terminal domain-containing protein [Gammaproteobacteria bacterium]|nr:MAG: heme biosynthesis HemY N-terminal domain-containing protein [Gammaproteobacteria bacterium]